MREFLTVWYEWATQPKVEDTFHFNRNNGLCACLSSFSKGDVDLHMELVTMLENDFKGNYQFPFEGKLPTYWDSKLKSTLYKNPKRVNWVKSKIE